ncbi:MAG TPA: KpsF/GutQ family sugar-phosphate isomerase [Bryobacteraceae bacterium]|jgi:arabinose-5-phosphate isomerase|nr:KpsF/GutQ family sugar-phosphate isomerase [Bryobacteraceae bacterium]
MNANAPASVWLDAARKAMQIEANAVIRASGRLDGNLTCAVELILAHQGKLVVTGLGKSGHVARKIVATLCSTGTPAVFLHASEASHGDLGLYSPGDPTLMISKSGNSFELLQLIPFLRELPSRRIGIIGNASSPLAAEMDVVLDASVEREADPDNFAPTASSTVALALGHALAVALMRARNFSVEDFGRFHPGGHLGRSLRLTVREVMHGRDEIAWAHPGDSLKQVVIAMTHYPHGAACIVDESHRLCGLITDGDVRRALQAHDDIRGLRASEVMTAHPATIQPSARLQEALRVMEDRPSQISVLPVVEAATGECLGLLRLHDLYRADMRADVRAGLL